MHLPDVRALWDDPKSELERFVKQPVQDDQDYINQFSLIVGRVAAAIAQLESEYAIVRLKRETLFVERQLELCDILGDDGKPVHTLASAERALTPDPVLQHLRKEEIELTRRINLHKAMMKALGCKERLLPGEQGRLNKFIESERRAK